MQLQWQRRLLGRVWEAPYNLAIPAATALRLLQRLPLLGLLGHLLCRQCRRCCFPCGSLAGRVKAQALPACHTSETAPEGFCMRPALLFCQLYLQETGGRAGKQAGTQSGRDWPGSST